MSKFGELKIPQCEKFENVADFEILKIKKLKQKSPNKKIPKFQNCQNLEFKIPELKKFGEFKIPEFSNFGHFKILEFFKFGGFKIPEFLKFGEYEKLENDKTYKSSKFQNC